MEHSFQDETVMKFNCNNGFNFTLDDMLDFPEEKEMMTDEFADSLTANSGHTSAITTVVESCNSSLSGCVEEQLNDNVCVNESRFSGNELFVPYDDLAELEWLSNFVEESYSTEEHNPVIPSTAVANRNPPSANFTQHSPLVIPTDVIIPTKPRSKLSRAVPFHWSTRLLPLLPPWRPETAPLRRREPSGKKCLHCESEKTPQWRTGPMGPNTLCNACGVRFKSGRLVPEYRPASSPTFLLSKHSNSHRKVLELQRQKQLRQLQLISTQSIRRL